MSKLLLLFGLFVLSGMFCYAAIVIQGDINSDTTFYLSNNPHQIRGTVRVVNGANLIIEPGVNIMFEEGSQLIIEGSVQAVGTSLVPIVFTSINTESYNTRIQLSGAEASSFQYCTFGRTNDGYGLMRISSSPNVSILHCSFGTSVAGNGVHIAGSGVSINYCSFNAISGKGIFVSSNVSLNLHESDFSNCQTALYVEENAYPNLTLSDLTISQTSSYPLYMAAEHYEVLNGLSVSNAAEPFLYVWDGYIDSDTTLRDLSTPYLLKSGLNVNNGATLTLEEGVQIRFPQHARLQVNNYGSLIASGTVDSPISFASAGSWGWKNISFAYNSHGSFSYCSFTGGGQQEYGYAEPTIVSNGAELLHFDNCDISGGSTYALYVEGSSAGGIELYDTTIHDAPQAGIYISNNSTTLDYNNLTITDCGKPIMLPANLIDDLDNQIVTADNVDNRIFIHSNGSINRASTFRNLGIPYVSVSTEIFTNYVPLTIEAGCQFHLGYSVGFNINGALSINGTEEQPVVFNRLPGETRNWRGFDLNTYCSAAVFRYCQLLNCASSNDYNHVQNAIKIYQADYVLVENTIIQNAICRALFIESNNSPSDSLRIENLTIDGCGMDAFYQNAADFRLSITGLSISNCNAYPLSISAKWAHQIEGISLNNNTHNLIRFINGGYLASQSLTNHGYPYQISGGPLYISYGISVSLEPGTVMYFDNALTIEINGTLEANGTPEQPIIFDRIPGSTSYWQGIRAYNNSSASFNWCVFNHGGRVNEYGYNACMLDYRGATNLYLGNCQILNTGAQAISITESSTGDSFMAEDLIIDTCGTDAVYCNDSDPSLSFTNLTISHCGRYPLDIPPQYASSFTNLQLVDNTNQYIRLSGSSTLYGSNSFPNHGYPYRQMVNIYGASGSNISIAAGCNFEIADGVIQDYAGSVLAQGNSEAPIIFDRVPGSTGYWMGIRVYNSTSTAILNHCQILHAGQADAYNNGYAFYNGGASAVSLTNCLVRYSTRQGIRLESSSSTDVFSMNNCTLQDINGDALVCGVPYHDLSVANVIINNINGYPLVCSADLVDKFSDLSFSNCSNPYIYISSGYQSRSATWNDMGLPYRMSQEFNVQDWVTLTLAAGAELIFPNYVVYQQGSAFNINGCIIANGSSSAPVIIRGLNSESLSTWCGLRIINPEGTCTLNYTNIMNAGLDEQHTPTQEYCSVYISGGTVNMNNCSIQKGNHNLLKLEGNGTCNLFATSLTGGTNGIVHNYGTLNMTNCVVSGCSSNGIYHNGGTLAFGTGISQWNKIYGNGINIYNNLSTPFNAAYIYWGTTQAASIDALLFDDQEGKGKISFEPWLDEACQNLYYITLDAPQDIQITQLPNQQLRISWQAVYDAQSYKLLAASSPQADTWSVLQQNIIGISVDITPTQTTMFYKVVAVK